MSVFEIGCGCGSIHRGLNIGKLVNGIHGKYCAYYEVMTVVFGGINLGDLLDTSFVVLQTWAVKTTWQ